MSALVSDAPQIEQSRVIAPARRQGLTIKAHLKLGSAVSLKIAARAGPAELVAVGALVSSILLAVAPIIWAARRRR